MHTMHAEIVCPYCGRKRRFFTNGYAATGREMITCDANSGCGGTFVADWQLRVDTKTKRIKGEGDAQEVTA